MREKWVIVSGAIPFSTWSQFQWIINQNGFQQWQSLTTNLVVVNGYKLDCIFFLYLLLTFMSNFVLIWCYLLFDSQTYFSIIIFYYKILEFKHLVDDIAIDLWSSLNFASMKHIRRKCNSTLNFSKFISNKKILSEVIVQSSLLLNLVLSAIMSWPL